MSQSDDNALVISEYESNDIVINPVAVDDKEGRLAVRAKIDLLEQKMQEVAGSEAGDATEINEKGLREHFVEGVYVRELFIPKDTVMVSRLWKRERMWIIASGEVTFTDEMGTRRIKAPFTRIVPPGSKVALYTHEDTLWFAIAASDAKNNADAEADLIAADYSGCIYPWDLLEEPKE